MSKPSDIIIKVRAEADGIQKKLEFLLQPENSNDYKDEQMRAAFRADNSFRGWRGFDLAELEQTFQDD